MRRMSRLNDWKRKLAAAGLAAVCLAAAPAQAQSQGAQYYGGQSYGAGDWRGFYAGAHLGLGIGDAGGANTSGAVGGAQAGYNWQSDQFVFGGEIDASLSGVEHSGFGARYRQNWTATGRARAGVAVNQALVYGTAGLALAGTEYRDNLAKTDKTATGFAIGAGAEFKLTPQVSARGELLHYNFERNDYRTATGAVSLSPTTNVLRGGLNVRF